MIGQIKAVMLFLVQRQSKNGSKAKSVTLTFEGDKRIIQEFKVLEQKH